MPVVGLDLGGTKLSGAVFSEDGSVLFKENSSLEKRRGNEVGKLISGMISSLIKRSGDDKVRSVGICVPGISYKKSGTVWAPNIPGWDNYPLLNEIKTTAGNDIKVDIDSDRACYILGEKWKGAAKSAKDAIFLGVGTGIGAGIMINGEVLRGSNDIAGAIGWLALDRPFKSEYVSCGNFEYNASGEGLAKIAREFLAEDRKNTMNGVPASEIKAKDVFDAYDSGDPTAVRVINNAVEYWGMAVANLVSLFNPEIIIFGGGVFGPALRFLDRIYDEAKKWAQPISIKQVELKGAGLGSDAGLIGAGYLALKNL